MCFIVTADGDIHCSLSLPVYFCKAEPEGYFFSVTYFVIESVYGK